MKTVCFLILIFASITSFADLVPNVNLTPGALCSPTDPFFQNYDYPEHIARCTRHIMEAEKQQVASLYGNIPKSQWSEYEFDHLLPLCSGGSNDIKNLWPEPILDAHQKDGLENEICLRMKAGTMTQVEAVQKVHDWFNKASVSDEPKAIVCKSNGPLKIDLVRDAANTISKVRVSLVDEDGEHQTVRSDNPLIGMTVSAESALLKGYLRFILLSEVRDQFEVFLPERMTGPSNSFVGFFKFAFEDNYPTLELLNCQEQSTLKQQSSARGLQ